MFPPIPFANPSKAGISELERVFAEKTCAGGLILTEEELKEKGYTRFLGTVHAVVYDYFQCATPRKARWYHKDGVYVCRGCSLGCETDDPEGFQAFLLS